MKGLVCLAESRQLIKEHHKVKTNYKIDNHKSDLRIHLEGIRAEYAVAKYLNILLDISISASGDNNKFDLISPENKTIQVKYRDKAGWDYALINADPTGFKSDIGILVWPGQFANQLIIVGYITKNDFLRYSIIKDFTYGPRLVVEHQHFKDIDDLL